MRIHFSGFTFSGEPRENAFLKGYKIVLRQANFELYLACKEYTGLILLLCHHLCMLLSLIAGLGMIMSGKKQKRTLLFCGHFFLGHKGECMLSCRIAKPLP